MVGGADDALVFGVAAVALLLAPVASWLIRRVGDDISAALDGEVARVETEIERG
jgi:hypothetical protein